MLKDQQICLMENNKKIMDNNNKLIESISHIDEKIENKSSLCPIASAHK